MSLRSPFSKGGYRGIFHVIVKSSLTPLSKGGDFLRNRHFCLSERLKKGFIRSMGTGKRIVELFSAAI